MINNITWLLFVIQVKFKPNKSTSIPAPLEIINMFHAIWKYVQPQDGIKLLEILRLHAETTQLQRCIRQVYNLEISCIYTHVHIVPRVSFV